MMGSIRASGLLVAFGCMVLALLPGCDGCSCGRKARPPVDQVTNAQLTNPAAVAIQGAGNKGAVPGDGIPERLDRLASVAALVPASVDWVAVFDPVHLRDNLHKVGRIAPKLTRGRDYKDIQARIFEIYGVQFDMVKGPCLFARLSSGEGRLLVCAGVDKVVEPVDASIWTMGDFRGPIVLRRGSTRVSLGVVDGRLIAGDENAVFAAVTHYIAKQPSLGSVFKRKSGIFRDLAAEDAWGGTALFFPGRFDPGWCPAATCSGSAIFSGNDNFVVVSIATSPDGTAAVRSNMEAAWRENVLVAWEAARANPRVLPEMLRDGDRSIVENGFRVRADRVIFEAGGDLFDVLSVIRMDAIDWLLGN